MVSKKAYYKSPLGWLEIESDGKAITSIIFVSKARKNAKDALLDQAIKQIDQYFKGRLNKFSLRVRAEGTLFQRKVWTQLQKIGNGKTVSYQEVASRIGRRKAVRAAGSAIGKNPLSILIPCHRVIASDGSMGGYAGGLWRKKWLLKHEEKFQK